MVAKDIIWSEIGNYHCGFESRKLVIVKDSLEKWF